MESIYEVVTCGQLRAAISEGEIQYSRGIKLSADRVLGARLNLRNLQL